MGTKGTAAGVSPKAGTLATFADMLCVPGDQYDFFIEFVTGAEIEL